MILKSYRVLKFMSQSYFYICIVIYFVLLLNILVSIFFTSLKQHNLSYPYNIIIYLEIYKKFNYFWVLLNAIIQYIVYAYKYCQFNTVPIVQSM
jgi:hypothetical protein